MEILNFIKEFIIHPVLISSITPSSKRLSSTMVSMVTHGKEARYIFELGCGTGAITEEIIKTFGEAKILCIDINPAFTNLISAKFPYVTSINDKAENMEKHAKKYSIDAVDIVFSSLPWSAFNTETQKHILEAIFRILRPGGELLTYSYLHTKILFPSHKRFIKLANSIFASVTTSSVVWRNIPPAIIVKCKK